MITELFLGFLGPVGVLVEVPPLWKNTRDEVLWLKARRPWRRSALWLLVRVAIQLQCSRMLESADTAKTFYKSFMAFFLSKVLELSHQYVENLHIDLIYAMNAKLSRRLHKITVAKSPGLEVVQKIMQSMYQILQDRWWTVMVRPEPGIELGGLSSLDFLADAVICLPELQQYLQLRHHRENKSDSAVFRPGSGIVQHPAEHLPGVSVLMSNSDSLWYNLNSIERWVQLNLDSWLSNHQADSSTCQHLSDLIRNYHSLACTTYSESPEATSRMILTILDLWIACDKAATYECGMLLDYDPCIPQQLLISLVLPFKSQMGRLLSIERYLQERHGRRSPHMPSIYQGFGTEKAFSVRYFAMSQLHQDLLKDIQATATSALQAKKSELTCKKTQYNDLMALHASTECEYRQVLIDSYIDDDGKVQNDYIPEHCSTCKKCSYEAQANGLAIGVHEWPLPSVSFEAQSVVFELKVPSWFGHWRDISLFLRSDVLQAEYNTRRCPGPKYPLGTYSGLSSFFTPFGQAQRIGLLSEAKPHEDTHRQDKPVGKATESDICLNNGLEFQYYDTKNQCFLSTLGQTDIIPKRCTFTLPDQAASLQRFLTRPYPTPQGPSPNSAVASLSQYPVGMPFDEYRALSNVPLGCRLQWQNILLQLSIPSVDFKKLETGLVVLQVLNQTSLSEGSDVLRESHAIVGNEVFTSAMLKAIHTMLQRIMDNWESFQALNILILLTTRILSLTSSDIVANNCLAELATLRQTAFKWANHLHSRAYNAAVDSERLDFRLKAVQIGLICANTFNLEDHRLNQALSIAKYSSIWVQCCILIHEEIATISSASDIMTAILYQRWKDIALRGSTILARGILQDSKFLDNAVLESWSAYEAGSSWQKVPESSGHWLVTHTAPNASGDSLSVHFNVLTGGLLVNGLPLTRLPSQYETHSNYRKLFGTATIEVMPTSVRACNSRAKRHTLATRYILA
jgi:hypothetical protein